MMAKKNRYTKPRITTKELKLNFFFTETPFLETIDDLLVPNVFARSGGGGCFLEGTNILMADGTTKEIQDIQSGDVTLSYNVEKSITEPEEVNKLVVHPYYHGGYLLINNTLKVTGNHPMWLPKLKRWWRAEKLRMGDTLLNNEGKEIIINSIKKVRGINYVYNLNLNGKNHNYFVENILVHNIGNDGDNKTQPGP